MKISTGNLFFLYFLHEKRITYRWNLKKRDPKKWFFCKIYRHVRHTLILICTLMSSIGKIYQKFEKMFRKIIISPICNRGQIYMLMYYGGNKNIFFNISKILPIGNSFLKTEIHIDLTDWWKRWFFTKNDKISLIFR